MREIAFQVLELLLVVTKGTSIFQAALVPGCL
jgi:hypothetical protein